MIEVDWMECEKCGAVIENGREYHRTITDILTLSRTYLCYDCIGDEPNKPPRYRE